MNPTQAELNAMVKFDPSGRIIPVTGADMLPGKCMVCGTTQHSRGFADLRVDLEFYGTAYLCYTCIAEVASIWKFTPPEKVAFNLGVIDQLNSEIARLNRQIKSMQGVIDGLAGDWANNRGLDTPASVHVSSGT